MIKRRWPLFLLGIALAAALLLQGPASWLMPWLAIGVIFVVGMVRYRKKRAIDRDLQRIHELSMLRHDREALGQAWQLVEATSDQPAIQHRVILHLTSTLDTLGQHEATLVGYDRLLSDLPDQHPGAVLLRIQRAVAQLFTQRLADADASLRSLRGPVESMTDTPVYAAYRFAQLFQAVQTAHYDEAITESDELIQTLRPLGIQAGYGHALRSWCHRKQGENELADRWWSHATALVPANDLNRRFAGLGLFKHD
jgi:tetratricopeptide (TPR) repeat protein